MFHSYSMVKNNQDLEQLYQSEKTKFIFNKVISEAKKLLEEKYKFTPIPSDNVKLLLSTRSQYKNIIFNYNQDIIFGSNFIGKELERLREYLYEKYGRIDFPPPKEVKNILTKDILKNEEYFTFSSNKTKDLYDMIQNYKENIKNDNDLDCFTFFYKNFNLDCISKISIKEFNKIKNPPFDFKKLLSLYDLSKECLQELWKYTVYVYFASKNVGNMNLLTNPNVPLQIIKSTDYLDTRNEPLTILGDNLSIQKFDNDILKEGDQTSIPFRNFKITEESKYSSLLPKHVKQVEQIFLTWFNHNDIKKIVDATAHIGVDSVHFRLMFPKAEINSYEINTNTYQLLEKNVKDFTIHTHNINFLKADLPSDISFVYIDAPWGGRNYNKIKEYI